MRWRPWRGVLAGVLVGLSLGMAAGRAESSPGEITVEPLAGRPPGATLRVRGQPVIQVFGADAARRLQDAARRLDPLLGPAVAITTTATRTLARLVVNDRVVFIAGRADAALAGMTPVSLARQWAEALEAALAVPSITLSQTGVVLSPGRRSIVAVTTMLTSSITVGAFDQQVAAVRPGGNEVVITGRNPGNTIIPLRIGPYRAQVAVSVRRPAGVIPAATTVIVTGLPAPADLIREAVERRLDEAVHRDPGATMEVGEIAPDGPLAPGVSATIRVAVALRSPYAGPVDGTVRVRVHNLPVQIVDPGVLLVSNRPETITGNGLLFQETLAPGTSARLLYHHMNGSPAQARVLKITLTNPGTTRARVHYLSGLAGPSSDPVLIGSTSTARFLDALASARGYVIEVPARGATTFTASALAPLALVSGLMQLQVIDGGPVDLTVHVRVPWILDRTVTADLAPGAYPHPRGTFPGSVVEIVREQPVDTPVPLGDLGIMSNLREVRTGEPLTGDYGVLYRMRLRLLNPTDREVTAAFVANAAGGPARGLFLIDGAPVDVGLIRATEDREVAIFTLAPGSRREVVVLTMPVAGSFYPVRLTLRPR